jgi:hypothetical protein
MDDIKDWLQSLLDSLDMDKSKELCTAMLHESESLVHVMRIIGADMHGYD